MGIEKLISVAAVVVMIAAATGQLPRFTMEVRKAQARLLHESRASTWGHLPVVTISKQR